LPVEDIMDRDALTSDHNFSSYINKESLPGQYDSTIDAVQQCLMLQTGQKDHNVRAFSTIIFENEISDENMKKVEKYLINPVDSHTTHIDDTTLLRELPSPENVKTLDEFRKLDDK
jgi:phosphoribosylformylglycinamidine synthase